MNSLLKSFISLLLTFTFAGCDVTATSEDAYKKGLAHYEGVGSSQDHKRAFEWFMKSAERGHAKAQFKVGELYLKGEGVEKDDHLAALWWRQAADQGYASAQFKLGLLHETGYKGILEQNLNEAQRYYRKAAEQGSAQATMRLAHLGTPRGPSE